jgi:hypothetical protein
VISSPEGFRHRPPPGSVDRSTAAMVATERTYERRLGVDLPPSRAPNARARAARSHEMRSGGPAQVQDPSAKIHDIANVVDELRVLEQLLRPSTWPTANRLRELRDRSEILRRDLRGLQSRFNDSGQ